MSEHENATILVTGGAGYIGSHCVLVLLERGYNVVAVDNFANSYSSPDGKESLALKRVEEISGKKVEFYNVDLLDKNALNSVFQKRTFQSVIHFAAYKNVTESAYKPLPYYKNNLLGLINVLEVMQENHVHNLVFSGSCTVYGHPEVQPVSEDAAVGSVKNPYGRTKYFSEEIMKDFVQAHPEFKMISLRYFNPIGAHPSGLIGEDPKKVNVNIVPFLGEVAVGHAEQFTVFGDDYETPDGTCIRDYTHIMDLAEGHVLAMKKLLETESVGWKAYNLGIGKGFSVKQLIHAFEEASDTKIKTVVVARRPFNIDAPRVQADPTKAKQELNYAPKCTDPVQMCKDFWTWKQKNPNGYRQVQRNIN